MKRAFSGIQPSGVIHIGNYLGAIKNWVALQNEYECFFCVVDLHAITVPQKPDELCENIRRIANIYMAAGIDSKKSTIFIQSHIPEHTELAWILNTVTKIPELEKMTQFKDKAKQFKNSVNVGLFDYPVLMAADILLYKTNIVPVGEDQIQHVELTRDLAKRFNLNFGKNIFTIPEVLVHKIGARIMGLDDPNKKMSKSATSTYNYISLTDLPDTVRDKLKKAVTDSGKEIIYDEDKKPAISNLLNIYSLVTDRDIKEIENEYKNAQSYAEFKENLAQVLIDFLKPFQKKLKELEKDKIYTDKIIKEGAEKTRKIAQDTLREVKNAMGLI